MLIPENESVDTLQVLLIRLVSLYSLNVMIAHILGRMPKAFQKRFKVHLQPYYTTIDTIGQKDDNDDLVDNPFLLNGATTTMSYTTEV